EDPTERWQVEAALLELSSEHRQVILEIYYRGRTARDLARRLALPEGTVRSRLYYGLRQLRHNLERSGWQS
ncbi:MAG: sigma factor-like helix-turn-helix DNA-binding protein, partial [Candidatus Dormibacteria bacterium]